MAQQPLTREQVQEAIDALAKYGSQAKAATALGIGRGTLQNRIAAAERIDRTARIQQWTYEREKSLWMDSGSIVVFSDAHFWPGERSTAFAGLVEVVKVIKPRVVIANGDVFDGVSVSRHDPFGWSNRPKVKDEIEACQERMHELELAKPNGCQLLFNVGNHDLRFERALCTKAPEYIGMGMTRLADHFPAWEMQWSVHVNAKSPGATMIKHRFRNGGVHAAYNATMKAGISTVSGHTHILEVKPWGDYTGRRYGVQTGYCADPDSPSFEYEENNPSPACSGFAVLSYREGRLLPPELAEVVDGRCYFRGEIIA